MIAKKIEDEIWPPKRKVYLCYCKTCEEFFTGERKMWKMYDCPHCKKNAVDIEDNYTRLIGDVKVIRQLKIPEPEKLK